MANDPPAMHPGTRTDIKDIIGLADRFFVMFDNNHCVALIAQVFQRLQQTVVVALMQADGRFVEHIKHPREPRPDLRGKTDTLAFPAAQCAA